MRILSILVMLLFCSTFMHGQTNPSEAAKQINSIKLNKDYITAESTAESPDQAYDNARALLELNIEEWIKTTNTKESVQGYIAKSRNSVLELKTMRGNRYRTFLYVKKSDVMTFEESKDIIVAPVHQEPPRQDAAVPTSERVTSASAVTVTKKYQPTEEEQRMLSVSSSSQIEPFIRNNPHITNYGKFKDLPASGKCYLFVYNREGSVPAVLLRDTNGYQNVKTGNSDDISNYKGCGAIWFRYN